MEAYSPKAVRSSWVIRRSIRAPLISAFSRAIISRALPIDCMAAACWKIDRSGTAASWS
ncbi:hypothetical protein Aros01_03174 [Streptosporangium roseum]